MDLKRPKIWYTVFKLFKAIAGAIINKTEIIGSICNQRLTFSCFGYCILETKVNSNPHVRTVITLKEPTLNKCIKKNLLLTGPS